MTADERPANPAALEEFVHNHNSTCEGCKAFHMQAYLLAHAFRVLEAELLSLKHRFEDCSKANGELIVRAEKAEAELAKYRDAEHIYGKHFAEKAEKAEKERDALKARVRELEAAT